MLPLLVSCGNPYRTLQERPKTYSALRYQPVFEKELYRCIVDGKLLFKKFHLSGLLFFKKMENKTTRVVFQNEMGVSFFDFEWSVNDSFKVYHIIPQLDKPAVIKILQKDMQLLLMKELDLGSEQQFVKDNRVYNRFRLDKGFAYYISAGDTLQRIENVGKSKVITIESGSRVAASSLPETVFFRHHKANFTIQLSKIHKDAAE
ncbi:MAG TPA: hypothetical protein VL098_12000 [Flavipsychrobacter sp.]|nr:hypothetical protein [Flavipsychrobacter sp.]